MRDGDIPAPDAKLQHRGQEYRHLAYSILASGCADALIEE
jgi:hypothetical protein